MAFAPRGFVPYRHLSGAVNPSTRRYRTHANNKKPIFVNDLVVLVSGSAATAGFGVDRYTVGIDTTLGAGTILGVVQGILDSNRKPLVFSQPTRGPYLQAATDGYLDVIVDPHQTYLAMVDGTASALMIGRYVGVTATAMGTAEGISNLGIGAAVTSNPIYVNISATTAPQLHNPAFPLLCVGIAEFEDDVDEETLATVVNDFADGQLELLVVNGLFTGKGRTSR